MEEDDGKVENGEEKAGTFCGSVLLNSVSFDVDKVMADLKAEWGIEPSGKPEDMASDDARADESTRVFYLGETLVAISLMPARVPDGEAEYYAETNYMWPKAVEVTKTHKAHVLVAVLAHGLTPVEAGKLHVKVIATCLTAFLQTTILYLGLLTYTQHALLAVGICLSATEVPRIAQMYGLDTSVRVNMMSVSHTVSMGAKAVNMIKTKA